MRTHAVLSCVSLTICGGMLAAQTVSTQVSPAGEPNGLPNTVYITSGIAMPGAGAGQVTMMSHEFSIFPDKPVTGAPYSADRVTEHVQTLADGNRIVNTTTARVYRDSQGRTRTETSMPALPGAPAPPVMITIHDPVAGATYMFNSESKTAQKIVSKGLTLKLPGLDMQTLPDLGPLPPITLPQVTTRLEIANDEGEIGPQSKAQSQDLGEQTMEGIVVTGRRTVSAIPAGQIGNEQPIEIASERWFSPALRVVVKSVHTDPRIGQTTESLKNISRSEPDASLFQVPSDYAVTEGPRPFVKNFQIQKPQVFEFKQQQ